LTRASWFGEYVLFFTLAINKMSMVTFFIRF
jgi:hypothetical protein